MEAVFDMVYQTDFINAKEGDALLEAFENDENPEILDILESFQKHNDYLRLKNEITDVAEKIHK